MYPAVSVVYSNKFLLDGRGPGCLEMIAYPCKDTSRQARAECLVPFDTALNSALNGVPLWQKTCCQNFHYQRGTLDIKISKIFEN